MSENAVNKLKTIKSLDFKKWTATFWLIKRKIAHREAHYSVLRVDTDGKLQKRFRGYIAQQLQGKDFHITKYDFTIESEAD